MMKFRFYIDPMGAVRTTQRQKYTDLAAKRYSNYKKFIALKAKQHAQCGEPTTAACAVNICFIMPIPKSKQGKGLEGKPHTVKPDIDNLIKGAFDAVNKIIWKDDNQVVEVNASKVYEYPGCGGPGIEMEVIELF